MSSLEKSLGPVSGTAMMLNTAFEILSGLTGDCPKFRHKAEAVEWIKTFTGHVTLNRTPK